MFMLDTKYSINKNAKVGAAYYYVADNRAKADTVKPSPTFDKDNSAYNPNPVISGYLANGDPIYAVNPVVSSPSSNNGLKVHTLGLNAEGTFGPLTVNGFALSQFGDLTATKKAKGYEFNVGAKYDLGTLGTARCEFLYAPGGKNTLYSADNGDEGGGFYDNEMTILGRDKNQLTNDAAIVFNVSNNDQGVIFGSLGYDYTFTDKLSASANAGFAAVAESKGPNKSDFLGTEINAETNYKLSPSVTLGARAGYVMLGEYFKNFDAGKTPDNPYDVKLIAKYSF
jgi:hypothetical protein